MSRRGNPDTTSLAEGRTTGELSGSVRRTPSNAFSDRRHVLGRLGEAQVADCYRAAGYQVLARNWRCARGELDLVCRKGRLLVVCEVKTRSGHQFGSGFEAVGPAKRRRLRRATVEWLASQREWYPVIRFDVAAVSGKQVDVLEDAF